MYFFHIQGASTLNVAAFYDAWITPSLKDLDSWPVISSSEMNVSVFPSNVKRHHKMYFVSVFQAVAAFQDAWITPSLKDLDSWPVI
jgi:hypothetical protein